MGRVRASKEDTATSGDGHKKGCGCHKKKGISTPTPKDRLCHGIMCIINAYLGLGCICLHFHALVYHMNVFPCHSVIWLPLNSSGPIRKHKDTFAPSALIS